MRLAVTVVLQWQCQKKTSVYLAETVPAADWEFATIRW